MKHAAAQIESKVDAVHSSVQVGFFTLSFNPAPLIWVLD